MISPATEPRRSTTDLVRAEQGPAELPRLRRRLSLGQPLLGHVLMLHVRVKVQLVQSLGEERATEAKVSRYEFMRRSLGVRNLTISVPIFPFQKQP